MALEGSRGEDFMLQLSGFSDFSIESNKDHRLQIKCPGCLHNGSFEPLGGLQDVRATGKDLFDDDDYSFLRIGIRVCPVSTCRMLVFFTSDWSGADARVHPAPAPNFNPTDLPDKVLRSFQEALLCYESGCFVASAMMVRKTLEEVCCDLHFKGKNLQERIEELKSKVTLPVELLNALHDLRLLGNDAAHFELKNFDEIGKNELDASIDVVKELLKGLYQFKALTGKLSALKKSQTP